MNYSSQQITISTICSVKSNKMSITTRQPCSEVSHQTHGRWDNRKSGRKKLNYC